MCCQKSKVAVYPCASDEQPSAVCLLNSVGAKKGVKFSRNGKISVIQKPNLIQAVVEVYVISTKMESSWLLFMSYECLLKWICLQILPCSFSCLQCRTCAVTKIMMCITGTALSQNTVCEKGIIWYKTTNRNNGLTLCCMNTAHYEHEIRTPFREIATELLVIIPKNTNADGYWFDYIW